MEVRNTYISCMDTAYVREFPHPQNSLKIKVQETLHFRYLKFLVKVDDHPNSRGLYTHYKDSVLKVGWPSPT